MSVDIGRLILGPILLAAAVAGYLGAAGTKDGDNSVMSSTKTGGHRLTDTGSPYLEQHIGNPVDWYPWGEEAFLTAKQRDVPILISIGYSTCHWCHVMAHESFEDQATAEAMNASVVSIKVDREQHPGVDSVYMEAAQALTGSGGWPLNVFVDHQGRPFLAVTYLPTERWSELVQEVSRYWKEDREKIYEASEAIAAHLSERRYPPGGDPEALESAMSQALATYYDHENPGYAGGGTPKFPPTQALDWLLEWGSAEEREKAMSILTAMMDSGLHDRVGGGFHRYTVDERWRIPHFEKMTYDNAQLMGLYARAGQLVGSTPVGAAFTAAAENTADWFLREMRVQGRNGQFLGYATATDADDPLGEGSYFAWSPEDLRAQLEIEDAEWLAQRWNLSGGGSLDNAAQTGHYEPKPNWIPHPRGAASYPEDYRSSSNSEATVAAAREAELIRVLREARSKRLAPARDDKVITAQNALVLEGFVRLARYGGKDKYRQAAEELADSLAAIAANPPLRRAEGLEAYITDYGYLSMAMAGAYSLLGHPRYIDAALAAALEARAELSVGDGTYYAVPASSQGLFKRPIEEFDGPSPAGQHALGIAFGRLYAITGDPTWKTAIEELLTARLSLGIAAPSAAPSLVRLASIGRNPYSLVLAGPADHAALTALKKSALEHSGPDMMVVIAEDAAAAGYEWAELEGRLGLPDPQVLVCREGSCLLPAFTEEEAKARLDSLRSGSPPPLLSDPSPLE